MYFFTKVPHLTATAFVAAVGARKVTGEPAVGKAAKVMEVILVEHPGDWYGLTCFIITLLNC